MSTPDLNALLAKAQQMQSRMTEMQKELAVKTVEGSSGGGMVKAVASGELRILEIQIEPQLLESGDRSMLQDLVAAAVNAALANAQQMVQQEMQRVAGNPLTQFFGGGDGGSSGGPAQGPG